MVTTYEDPDHPEDLVADLVAIAVEPKLQSRGVGGALLERAFALVAGAEPPLKEMWLVVAENNQRAQRFFGRHGFRLGRGLGVYPAGQRALRMVKPISKHGTAA